MQATKIHISLNVPLIRCLSAYKIIGYRMCIPIWAFPVCIWHKSHFLAWCILAFRSAELQLYINLSTIFSLLKWVISIFPLQPCWLTNKTGQQRKNKGRRTIFFHRFRLFFMWLIIIPILDPADKKTVEILMAEQGYRQGRKKGWIDQRKYVNQNKEYQQFSVKHKAYLYNTNPGLTFFLFNNS